MGYCCQATAQAWKTSCLGHCPPLPPTPTIFPHPPTLSFKEVLTTLALLFGPQNIPQPPIWLSAEKESQAGESRAEEVAGRRGCGDGLLLAVWCQYGLFIKEKSWSCLLVERGGRVWGSCIRKCFKTFPIDSLYDVIPTSSVKKRKTSFFQATENLKSCPKSKHDSSVVSLPFHLS